MYQSPQNSQVNIQHLNNSSCGDFNSGHTTKQHEQDNKTHSRQPNANKPYKAESMLLNSIKWSNDQMLPIHDPLTTTPVPPRKPWPEGSSALPGIRQHWIKNLHSTTKASAPSRPATKHECSSSSNRSTATRSGSVLGDNRHCNLDSAAFSYDRCVPHTYGIPGTRSSLQFTLFQGFICLQKTERLLIPVTAVTSYRQYLTSSALQQSEQWTGRLTSSHYKDVPGMYEYSSINSNML